MSSEDFQQMMARSRARERDLSQGLADLEENLQEYARDHHDFIAAVDADQVTSPAPQHPVGEALNTFTSTQAVAGAAPDSDADVQMAEDEGSLFEPDEAAIEAQLQPVTPPLRRRVTFAESDIIIAGVASPEASQDGQQSNIAESVEIEVPSDDAHIPYNRPESIDYPPVLPTNKPASNPHDYVGHFDPSVRAGRPSKPLQQGEYEDLSARAEEMDTLYVCPYPECGNMYTSSPSVESSNLFQTVPVRKMNRKQKFEPPMMTYYVASRRIGSKTLSPILSNSYCFSCSYGDSDSSDILSYDCANIHSQALVINPSRTWSISSRET